MSSASASADPRTCVCGVGRPVDPSVPLDAELKGLLENNKTWVESVQQHDPEFLKTIGAGQDPKFLYIGCADARVEPLRIFGLKHGELFVHRNVGNCCPSDLNFLSVLEYAVSFLKVPHIIVCGHYDCGAVRNSVKVQDIGLLENWLRQIRDVRRIHEAELSAITDSEARHRRLVELNVIEQARNVQKAACVQRRRNETKENHQESYPFATPVVHAFVVDPGTGLVTKLDDELMVNEDVYGLY